MSRLKFVTWAGAGLVLGASVLAAGTAQASSTGCAFSNGCATLHGTDANGNAVAMDAKYQRKTEILIGYPDNVGDNATSFDGVLHYGHGKATKGWSDSGLTLWGSTLNGTVASASIPSGDTAITVADAIPAYNPVTGCVDFTVTGGLPFTTPSGIAGYKASLSGLAGAVVTISPFSGGTSKGTICVNGDNLQPNVYHNLTLTISDSSTAAAVGPLPAGPETFSVNFAAEVHGVKVTTPGAHTPFYTFVYAAHGVWSNQCVTDTNGSGALRLETCTLGKNKGQDFTIDSTNGLLDGSQHHVSDLLAAAVNSGHSCLTDPSTSNAATPQSDAADEVAPGGRQLYVNGSCAVNANLWSWGT